MSRYAADIQIDAAPHEQFVGLVEATEFGSGDMRYRRLGVSAQLARFNKPAFFHALDSRGELVGVYVIDERDLIVADRRIRGFYRGVLAVDKRCQGQGIGRQLTSVAKSWIADEVKTSNRVFETQRKSDVRVDVEHHDRTRIDEKSIDEPMIDEKCTHKASTDQPDIDKALSCVSESPLALSYGCIDQSNIRSLALLESTGAFVTSTLSMYMMYRQFPSVSCTVEPLTSVQASDANTLKAELYGDCLVKDVTRSGVTELALCDSQGVAISARVHPSAFNIVQMGAVTTFVTRYFVKPFPFARKRFDPESFTYVTFCDVLIRQGAERLWPQFVNTVLAQHGCHYGVTYVDPRSQFFVRLQKASALSRFVHTSQGSINVVLQSCGLDGVIDAKLRENSAAVKLSPIDV